MGNLIRRLRQMLWRVVIPSVLDDHELMQLCQITAADLAMVRQEADARTRPGNPGPYWLDDRGHRQWRLRATLPLVVRTLRGVNR